MAQRVVVGRWGANLAVRRPRGAALAAGFENGTSVEVVIRSVRPRYSLDELLEGVTPEAMRDAFDWGPDAGREAVD